MPQIVSAASGPLENVDKITMYGEGNSAKLVGDVMQTTNKVMEAMAENGIDVKALLAGFMGGKASN
jgi:flotillin